MFIQEIKFVPKLNFFSESFMKDHEILSNAFSKSTRRIRPFCCCSLQLIMMSYISRVHSFIDFPSRKPFCSGLISFFSNGRSLLVLQVEINL